jgi:hypothetical protein
MDSKKPLLIQMTWIISIGNQKTPVYQRLAYPHFPRNALNSGDPNYDFYRQELLC